MKKTMAMLLALLLVAVMLPVMAMAEGANVAKIGETEYPTLKEAFDAVQEGQIIEVMRDCSGNGIKVQSGKKFTVDFNNCTYNIDGETVGSTGTETNGFQLLKDSTITFKNGKLTSTKAKILIQNYCNLTLENMELDGSNLNRSNPNYTLSNNNGNVVIDGTKISAADGMVAFDVCRYADYVGPKVTVKGNSVINGKVEISSSGAKEGARHELVIENGTFNGQIVKVDESPNFSSSISGGTFKKGVDESYIVDGKKLDANGNVVPESITIIVPSEGGSTTTTPSTDNTKNPSTGANDFVGVAAALAVVSVLGAAVAVRKK